MRNAPWISFLLFAAAIYVLVFPYAEFNTDDGSWVLDAYLRLQGGPWLAPTIRSSQGIGNPPLAAWLFALPLALYPSITALQILVAAAQLTTLFLVRQIGRALSLWQDGLLVGALYVLLPALTLNYSGKLCNDGFLGLASAFLLWSWLCWCGRARWILLALSFTFAVAVHFSFALFLIPLSLEVWGIRPRPRTEAAVGVAFAALLGLSIAIPEWLPLLRSLLDVVVPGSGYMHHRNLPEEATKSLPFFIPWALLLFAFGLNRALSGEAPKSPQRKLVMIFLCSAWPLLPLAFILKGAPHQWAIAWVLPFLFLVQFGIESFGDRKIRTAVAATFLLESAIVCIGAWMDIARTGGSAWHGPSLQGKRDTLTFLAIHYPEARLSLIANGDVSGMNELGWIALLSLPREFSGRFPAANTHQIILEERGFRGETADLSFATRAGAANWKMVFQEGPVYVWDAGMAEEKIGSPLTEVRSRSEPGAHTGIFF